MQVPVRFIRAPMQRDPGSLGRPARGPTTSVFETNNDNPTDPYHAHVYFAADTLPVAQRLHQDLNDMLANGSLGGLILVGKMHDQGVGPHPKPQFEIQFLASTLPAIVPLLTATGLASLVHPVTDDDLADHTTLAQWIGDPLPLDESVLDPVGHNKGLARFGKVSFGQPAVA